MRYLACSKVEKPKVARDVVNLWRKLEPIGRFLARKDETKRGAGSVKANDNVWYEVGDKKAREKASQCLRERTPDVIPYIKHLRDQQNAMTEHGVSMIQQKLQMQEQEQQLAVSFQSVYPPVATSNMVAPFPRRNTKPIPSQHMNPSSQPVLSAPIVDRMGDLPSLYQIQERINLVGSNARRGSLPVLSQHQFLLAQHQQQQQQMAAGIMYDGCLPDNEMLFSGEITDAEYQQNLLMQRQLQLRQLQLQRIQQQRLMQQQQQHLRRQGSQIGNYPMLDMNSERSLSIQQLNIIRRGVVRDSNGIQMMGSYSEPHNVTRMNSGMLGMNPSSSRMSVVGLDQVPQKDSGEHHPNAADTALLLGKLPQAQPFQSASNRNIPKANPVSAVLRPKRKLGNPPSQKSVIPDSNRSAGIDNLLDLQPADINSDTNDFTLEEYRQQLEEYISNSTNNHHNMIHHGAPLVVDKRTSHLKVDDDNENGSDLEDDWVKEKSNRSGKSPASENKRKVNRTISGVSAVSTYTKGSTVGMSLVSGMSGLDDMMSATTDNLERERERKLRLSSSDLSLMSELSDLSQNIDNLSLCEEDL